MAPLARSRTRRCLASTIARAALATLLTLQLVQHAAGARWPAGSRLRGTAASTDAALPSGWPADSAADPLISALPLRRALLQAAAPAPAQQKKGLSGVQKLGIALGAVLGFMLIKVAMCGCWFARRHMRKKKRAEMEEKVFSAGPTDWELELDDIAIMKRPDGSDWELGAGNFGKVLKGVRGGVQPVAVKQMFRRDAAMEEAFIREIAMLKYVSRDRNIVQFYGACVQSNNLLLVAELMEGGDLRGALTRDTARELGWFGRGKGVAVDIARGLAFLHSSRVIHRDLKSKNVLLTREGMAKIADVGMAQIITEGYLSRDNALGTMAWAAPELLLGEKCTEMVDIYSFGVCLWEIVTGDMPQRGALRDVRVPEECPQEVADLIAACLLRTAKARPSAREVCRQLYHAAPSWEEPADVRAMLDEPSYDISEGVDMFGNVMSEGSNGTLDDSAETLSKVLDAKPNHAKGEKPQLQSVVHAIRAKLEMTRKDSGYASSNAGSHAMHSPAPSTQNGSNSYAISVPSTANGSLQQTSMGSDV